MKSRICHIKKTDCTVNTWSGGTTTQLAISPADGNYAQRSFDWRISSATVDTDMSTFTALPGITRYITTLCGTMELKHKDHHTVTLSPFEVDTFDGAWETTSYGKVTDFNLMLGTGTRGLLYCASVPAGHKTAFGFTHINDEENLRTLAVYAAQSPILCETGQESFQLQTGDLLLIEIEGQSSDSLLSVAALTEDAALCIAEISKGF